MLERCQRSAENRDYGFNWTLFLARLWEADVPYDTDVCVRPSTLEKQNGYEYKSDGGQSNGSKEPRWAKGTEADPETVGNTYADGSIEWTAQELTVDSLRDQIDDSTWTYDPSLTVSDTLIVDTPGLQRTSGVVTGGVAGTTYDILNEITTVGGKKFHGILRLTIEE